MIKRITQLLAGAALMVGTQAAAQTCGGTYVVQPGNSLSGIVDDLYKDNKLWTRVYQANAA
ncbi:MAG: LysM peptidoglycan-binding domain-containing protein, partial [Planktomarina sp.]